MEDVGVGRRVRARRALLGMRQADLAERAGLSREAVSHFERGVGRPRRATLEAIARALGVDVAEL